MNHRNHVFQLLFVGAVTTVVAVWGSPEAALAAAGICKVLATLARPPRRPHDRDRD